MSQCNKGVDDNLLFFFLFLVLLFCNPGIFGCGDKYDCCEARPQC